MSEAGKRVFPIWFTMVRHLRVSSPPPRRVYSVTKDKIKQNERLRFIKSVLLAAGITVPAEPSDVEKVFSERVKEIKDNDGKTKYFVMYNEDRSAVSTYVLVRSGAGLWGRLPPRWSEGRPELLWRASKSSIKAKPGTGRAHHRTVVHGSVQGQEKPAHDGARGQPAGDNQFQAITGATYTTNAIKTS